MRVRRDFGIGSLPAFMSSAVSVPEGFRAGMVALVGRTNAGKSTLLNALVDAKISIVSPKPQTTREAVQGIVHRPHAQIVFVDTPGFFKTGRSRLVDRLHARAREALEGIDVVVHLADPTRPLGPEDDMVLEALRGVTQPRVLALGKADLKRRPHTEAWRAKAENYRAVVDVSGAARRGLKPLLDALIPLLPVGEPLYGPEEITNATREFRIAEIIREKVYLLTGEEVPYRTAVELDLVEERTAKKSGPILHIKAAILVANERYKGMLIGAGGRKVREIGVAARADLEAFLKRKAFLDLAILVDPKLE